jgi:hypothetical protein
MPLVLGDEAIEAYTSQSNDLWNGKREEKRKEKERRTLQEIADTSINMSGNISTR